MVDTRRVADDKRRSVVRFRFGDSVKELLFVRTHSALRDVNVAVTHSHHAEVFLLRSLAARGEFRDRAGRSRFTCLSAGVGVNFGIYDEYVDVFALSENVIESAVTDVLSPTVAAEDPDGLLDYAIERILNGFEYFFKFALVVLNRRIERNFEGFLNFFGDFRAFFIGKPFLERVADSSAETEFESPFHKFAEATASLSVSEVEAVTEFGVVFKQRV